LRRGPAENRADADDSAALLDHLVHTVLCVIGINGVVAESVEVVRRCDASALQSGTHATTLAVVDVAAPVLDTDVAGRKSPRHVAALLVMVSHDDPFGSAASPDGMLGRRRH
jgi:hypothetical protein